MVIVTKVANIKDVIVHVDGFGSREGHDCAVIHAADHVSASMLRLSKVLTTNEI